MFQKLTNIWFSVNPDGQKEIYDFAKNISSQKRYKSNSNTLCPFCGSSPRKITLAKDQTVYNGGYIATYGCSNCTASVTGRGINPKLAWKSAMNVWGSSKKSKFDNKDTD